MHLLTDANTAFDVDKRQRELTQGNAEVQREELARRLGLDVRGVKPCVALIGKIDEDLREKYAYVLSIELVKAGISEDALLAYLGVYAQNCQQPPVADHYFGMQEAVAQGRKVLRMRERKQHIRGHGCKSPSSPLLCFCPYEAPAGMRNCPYIKGKRKAPTRASIAGLVGTFNAVRQLPVPAGWRYSRNGKRLPNGVPENIVARRRYVWMAIGAMEAAKGHAGREYIGSLSELAFETCIARRTLKKDLDAMEDAGWIRQWEGSRAPGAPPKGRVIRRSLPSEADVANVLAGFPHAELAGTDVR